jgi:GTP-binding protein HflX
VKISALNGVGISGLLECITENLPPTRKRVLLLIPFDKGGLAARIRSRSRVLKEEYRNDGLFMDAVIDIADMHAVLDYILDEAEIR